MNKTKGNNMNIEFTGKSIVFTQNFENVNNLTKSEFIDKAMSIDDFVGKLEEI